MAVSRRVPARSLASFKPRPQASLTALTTWSLAPPTSARTTSKEDFSSAAAVAVAAGPAAGGAAAAEEKTEFDVELTEVGPNKVKVIKVVREVTGLGLKEAKEMVDGAPKVVKEGASKAEAEDIKTKLEAEGAKVNLK